MERLPAPENAVLQATAVIGDEFSHPVLTAVVEPKAPELEDRLRSLVAGEFVYDLG
jgi:predicted ATPase